MKFWEFKRDPYDIIVATSAQHACNLRQKMSGPLPDEEPHLMTRAELDKCRPSTPLTEPDDFAEKTIGQLLDEMDAAEAERKRVADFEARQVPLFPGVT